MFLGAEGMVAGGDVGTERRNFIVCTEEDDVKDTKITCCCIDVSWIL